MALRRQLPQAASRAVGHWWLLHYSFSPTMCSQRMKWVVWCRLPQPWASPSPPLFSSQGRPRPLLFRRPLLPQNMVAVVGAVGAARALHRHPLTSCTRSTQRMRCHRPSWGRLPRRPFGAMQPWPLGWGILATQPSAAPPPRTNCSKAARAQRPLSPWRTRKCSAQADFSRESPEDSQPPHARFAPPARASGHLLLLGLVLHQLPVVVAQCEQLEQTQMEQVQMEEVAKVLTYSGMFLGA
jgi:hypothetical protein